MNLARLFVIFGILFIALLGETEGRRRWFKRKYKTIGCAGRRQLNTVVGVGSNNHQIVDGDVELPHNSTVGRNNRRSQWRKLKCTGDNCPVVNNNSIANTNGTKWWRRSRNHRRIKCNNSRKWRFNKVAISEGHFNSTHTEVPRSQNADERKGQRNGNQKCKGRRARKGKCQRTEPHDNEDLNDEELSELDHSAENQLHNDRVTTTTSTTEVSIQENIL